MDPLSDTSNTLRHLTAHTNITSNLNSLKSAIEAEEIRALAAEASLAAGGGGGSGGYVDATSFGLIKHVSPVPGETTPIAALLAQNYVYSFPFTVSGTTPALSAGAIAGAPAAFRSSRTAVGSSANEKYATSDTPTLTRMVISGHFRVGETSAGNEYVCRIGPRDNAALDSDAKNGAYLIIDSYGACVALSRSGSTLTTTDVTGVDFTEWTNVVFDLVWGVSFDVYIEGVLVASHTTNVPTYTQLKHFAADLGVAVRTYVGGTVFADVSGVAVYVIP